MGSYRDAISDEMGGADMHIVFDMSGLYGESEDEFVGSADHSERSVASVSKA
jgi:hypothetical protein